jgi:hypothetical protein
MTVEERRRHQLYEGLVAVLGPEATATMMELLPPAGTKHATRDDIDHLEQRVESLVESLRGELLAAFRAELVSAVAGQTRAVIVATATATFGIGGLAVALAQLL